MSLPFPCQLHNNYIQNVLRSALLHGIKTATDCIHFLNEDLHNVAYFWLNYLSRSYCSFYLGKFYTNASKHNSPTFLMAIPVKFEYLLIIVLRFAYCYGSLIRLFLKELLPFLNAKSLYEQLLLHFKWEFFIGH